MLCASAYDVLCSIIQLIMIFLSIIKESVSDAYVAYDYNIITELTTLNADEKVKQCRRWVYISVVQSTIDFSYVHMYIFESV